MDQPDQNAQSRELLPEPTEGQAGHSIASATPASPFAQQHDGDAVACGALAHEVGPATSNTTIVRQLLDQECLKLSSSIDPLSRQTFMDGLESVVTTVCLARRVSTTRT